MPPCSHLTRSGTSIPGKRYFDKQAMEGISLAILVIGIAYEYRRPIQGFYYRLLIAAIPPRFLVIFNDENTHSCATARRSLLLSSTSHYPSTIQRDLPICLTEGKLDYKPAARSEFFTFNIKIPNRAHVRISFNTDNLGGNRND